MAETRVINGTHQQRCNRCKEWFDIELICWRSKGVRGSFCRKCDYRRKKSFENPNRVDIIPIPGCPAMSGVEVGRGTIDGEDVVQVKLSKSGKIVGFLASQVRWTVG